MPEALGRCAAFALATVLIGGCAGGEGSSTTAATVPPTAASTDATTQPRNNVSVVAHARVHKVRVYRAADDSGRPAHVLSNPTDNGGPLVFLVRERAGDWLLVDLPVRPNGSTGWVRSADVTLSQHDYSIEVELSAHRITVRRGTEVVLSEPIAVGTRSTPTPGGRFYIKELLQPPDPNTVYGPFAYGLSGFSNVLESFAGGEAIIGIHGNNDPSSLGRDVSQGCIRMSNSGIRLLARTLPLGTPVTISP